MYLIVGYNKQGILNSISTIFLPNQNDLIKKLILIV